jgi:hypothetical protein
MLYAAPVSTRKRLPDNWSSIWTSLPGATAFRRPRRLNFPASCRGPYTWWPCLHRSSDSNTDRRSPVPGQPGTARRRRPGGGGGACGAVSVLARSAVSATSLGLGAASTAAAAKTALAAAGAALHRRVHRVHRRHCAMLQMSV